MPNTSVRFGTSQRPPPSSVSCGMVLVYAFGVMASELVKAALGFKVTVLCFSNKRDRQCRRPHPFSSFFVF